MTEHPYYEINVVPADLEKVAKHHQLLREKYPVVTFTDDFVLTRRSIDARKGRVVYVLRFQHRDSIPLPNGFTSYTGPALVRPSGPERSVLIVGAGPAGYFAALELLQNGKHVIVVDRGKDVQSRRRDLRAIMQESIVNEDSNYCFGEGGAGTYSDGKLYTRSTKRGDVREVLHTFCNHGASTDIMIDAHPHIGTNKLPRILQAMRNTIINSGGEVLFGKRLIDFDVHGSNISNAYFADGSQIAFGAMILATGHSARDIYELLDRKGIAIEAKPFALGVRVEHAQALIDQIQYSSPERPEGLPAAPYSVVAQVGDRGVFSFCMCPGGMIVPSATAPGEIVVNGMSPSRRDSPWANSGFVTSIELSDIPPEHQTGNFSCLNYQKAVEQSMFSLGNGSQQAPAQRLVDFVKGVESNDLPDCSYVPGVFSASLHKALPKDIADRLAQGFTQVGRKLHGYLTNDAIVLGVESRTSAPVRIPRDKEMCNHPQVGNLFPCGEGAGYAGGIVSAGIDGINVARKVKELLSGGRV